MPNARETLPVVAAVQGLLYPESKALKWHFLVRGVEANDTLQESSKRTETREPL